jgi:type VI protein secretion system component Hcp
MTKNLLLAIVVLFIACAAGSAVAAAATDTSALRACVSKQGALRIANTCKKGEKPLTWNQKGPAGAPGAPGAPGPAGPAGAPAPAEPLEVSAHLDGIGDFAARSLALDAKNPTGKVEFGKLRFTKRADATSPTLLVRTASGQHFATATFTSRQLTYKLTDVTVFGFEADGEDEHVQLSFGKVEVSFQPANGAAAVTAGWDVKLNRSV